MKTLSLTQPWATLVAIGAKQFETRSWPTRYRGPLAIHASKGFPKDCRELCLEEPFLTTLHNAGYPSWRELPTGVVLCTCILFGCGEVELLTRSISDTEAIFGDYSDGRYAWRLTNVEQLPEPIAAKGALGLWEWRA
jgi:hypothetical protein